LDERKHGRNVGPLLAETGMHPIPSVTCKPAIYRRQILLWDTEDKMYLVSLYHEHQNLVDTIMKSKLLVIARRNGYFLNFLKFKEKEGHLLPPCWCLG
jgi:hypothetical protein